MAERAAGRVVWAVAKGLLLVALVAVPACVAVPFVFAEEWEATASANEGAGPSQTTGDARETPSGFPDDSHSQSSADGDDEVLDELADVTAPVIRAAYVTSNPAIAGSVAASAGDLFFGTPGTSLVLEVSDDESGLFDDEGTALVALADPAGRYQACEVSVITDGWLAVTIPLQEGAAFDASIVVSLSDIAGNTRIWSLAEEGEVTEGGICRGVENEALCLPGECGVDMPTGPSRLILDTTAPVLELFGASAGSFYDGPVGFTLTVVEDGMDPLAAYDPARSLLTIVRHASGGDAGAPVKAYSISDLAADGTLAFDLEGNGDGCFDIIASVTDLAGNTGTAAINEVTVDTVAPIVSVAFDNERAVQGSYYDAPRVATVSVLDHCFDARQTTVTLNASSWSDVQPVAGEWQQDSTDPDLWTAEVPFVCDGSYSFTVSATDKAGNAGELLEVEEFVIDTSSPAVSVEWGGKSLDEALDASQAVFEGTPFFDAEQTVTVTVTDRHLDLGRSCIVVDGASVDARAWSQQKLDDEAWSYSYVHTYTETPASGEHGGGLSYTPEVRVVDCAGNESTYASRPFVVDLSAPEVRSVAVDASPASEGRDDASGRDPIQFFNQKTTMTFMVSDLHGIERVELCDPSGFYEKDFHVKRGAFGATCSIELADGSDQFGDAVFGRDVYLLATDVAGNCRTWTIGRGGIVKCAAGSDNTGTVTINEAGVHPFALIADAVAPVTDLSGVTAGAYYNSSQTVHAMVTEHNFAYLQRFEGDRAVLRVTACAGNAGRATSAYEVSARSFVGSGPDWVYEEVFDSDGHYVVEASFDDYANNPSNVSRIEEFTIDMTAPVITVEFDNNDVRNGTYYDAARTATVTVTEHNFDPSLINVQTSGLIGSWSSNGDTHACSVFFGEGASHGLAVSGTDLAGNAAREVVEPEFAVDLTPPQIAFGGVAQRLGSMEGEDAYKATLQPNGAYNGVVAPAVIFTDEQGFDASDAEFTLVGNKVGDVSAAYGCVRSIEPTREVIQFDDFGVGDADTVYDINVDDIYTINARVVDLAGNEAAAAITFSVNRFGSNYIVTVEEGGRKIDLFESPILDEAPTVIVREINVSGADAEAAHSVLKEYANVTSEIERKDSGSSEGYRLDVIDRKATDYGWAEYVYTIRSANFGEDSSSDTGDGGQGVYRVNVACNDVASNANTTAEYWSSDARRAEASAKVGTAEFVLDEVGPVIDELSLPHIAARGSEYQASFHVTDDITRGNRVEVYVDGQRVAVTREGERVAEGDYVGGGTFEFVIPARSLATRQVAIKVTDYAGRFDARSGGGFFVTTLVPETAIATGLVAALGYVMCSRRRPR